MQNPTPAEQQKAASTVLNQMRKKNLSGMLAAQRDGTLDEFLAPHLAEYWTKQRAKQNERPVSDRSGATPYAVPAAGRTVAQRPVTMARPNAAPAAPTGGNADANPRGIQIFRVVSEQVRAEPLSTVKKDGLNEHCAYVVTDPSEKEVYCWVGKNCATKDEECADALAKDLAAKDLRSSRPVLVLKQLSGAVAAEHLQALTEIIFWQIISGANPVSVSAELKQKCSVAAAPKNAPLVALEYSTSGGGQYAPIEDAALSDSGKGLLSRDFLKPTRIVVVECGANSYVWIGAEVRAATVTPALDVLRRRISSQPGRVICQVRITSEPVVFTRLFGDSSTSLPKPAPAVVAAPVPTAVDPVAAVSAERKDSGAVSVAERMKRFSNSSGASSEAASRDPPKTTVAPTTDCGVGTEVDPSTLSVKERMALFKKDKPIAQPQPSKKQPIDIGVDVGMKEKKEMMENVLDPNKIHVHAADGVGTSRRSSFTVDDAPSDTAEVLTEACSGLDADPVVGGTAPVETHGDDHKNEAGDVNDKVLTKAVAIDGMGEMNQTVNDETVQDDVSPVIPVQPPTAAPPHVHKKHIPKFTAIESSPVVPIARKSIEEQNNSTNTIADDVAVVAVESVLTEPEMSQPIKDVAAESDSACKPVDNFVVQTNESLPTESENNQPNKETEKMVPDVPTTDNKRETSPKPAVVNVISPVHVDPDVTTAYTPMEEKNDSKASSPAEVEAGCCVVM